MSFERTRRPRFYIDAIQYLRAKGHLSRYQNFSGEGFSMYAPDMFNLRPNQIWNTENMPGWGDTDALTQLPEMGIAAYKSNLNIRFSNGIKALHSCNYFGCFNHNLRQSTTFIKPTLKYFSDSGTHIVNLYGVAGEDSVTEDMSFVSFYNHQDDVFSTFDNTGGAWGGEGGGNNNPFGGIHGAPSRTQAMMRNEGEGYTPPPGTGDGPGRTPDDIIGGGAHHDEDDVIEDEEDWDDPFNDDFIAEDDDPIENRTVEGHNGWGLIRFNDKNDNSTLEGMFPTGYDPRVYVDCTTPNTVSLELYEHSQGSLGDTSEGVIPQISSFSMGWTYLLEHSAELNVKMDYVFDGIDSRQGVSGQDITNIKYSSPPTWQMAQRTKTGNNTHQTFIRENPHFWKHTGIPNFGKVGAFEGRKRWTLDFKHFQEEVEANGVYPDHKGIFPEYNHKWSHPSINWTNQEGWIGLRQDLISRIVTGTMGGALKFLFQPDSADDSEIYLCKFVTNGLNFTQVAPNVWNFNMVIEEVW